MPTAMYDGRCQACDEEITADVDEVVKDEDLGWIHEHCADDKKAVDEKRPFKRANE